MITLSVYNPILSFILVCVINIFILHKDTKKSDKQITPFIFIFLTPKVFLNHRH